MLTHLANVEDVDQFYPQKIGDYLALSSLPYLCLLFPVLSHLHLHFPNVSGYSQTLHTLQYGVNPGEVVC